MLWTHGSEIVTLHGAKWMFWSYVNGHYPDEQDKNNAASLTLTHKTLISCIAFNQSSGYLIKDTLQTQTQTRIQLQSFYYFIIIPTEKDSDSRTKHQKPKWGIMTNSVHVFTLIPLWPPHPHPLAT